MEHHAQSIDDALIGGLSYKLKPGASYITNRRSVSYFASGGNDYSTSGVRVMKFNITSDQWLDPSTFQIAFRLNRTNIETSGVLQPIHYNPAIFFSRARLICGGVIVEDINDFDRLSVMLTELMSEEQQMIMATQGFGHRIGEGDDAVGVHRTEYIDMARVVMFKPLLGLFHQEKMIPLRFSPIQIELELVNDAGRPLVVSETAGSDGTPAKFKNWNITDIQCKCDLLTLDNALENEFASKLLSGTTLPINFSTWNHTNQSTGDNPDFSAHITRALTRLKSVFVTLSDLPSDSSNSAYKHATKFYHPNVSRVNGNYTIKDEHQFQIQVGSKLYPEYPVSSLAETLSQLMKVVGKPFHINPVTYRQTKYIIGMEFEKVPGAGFSGLSTKNGDLMTLNFRNCKQGDSGETPKRVFCALNYDAVLNIKDSGVEMMD